MGRLAATAAAVLAISAAGAAARAPDLSWGKAGVAFDRYRQDSVACGMAGATRNMSGQKEDGEVMHGLQEQNSILDAPSPSDNVLLDYVLVQHRTMQQQVPALQRYLVDGVASCLRARGYVPIVLTRTQSRALARLPHGSPQRFRFLHALASDGAIIAAQQVPGTAKATIR